MEVRDQHELKGNRRNATNSLKAYGNNNKGKVKEKNYNGKAKLSLEEIEKYRKDNKCLKCSEQVHVSRVCPKKNECNEPPRATIM